MENHLRCSLKECSVGTLDQNTGRVDVCTAMPSNGLKNIQPQLRISWTPKGEASFHQQCWENVIKSTRARNKKNIVFKIHATEKELIKEAAKTLEKHDPRAVIINEGKRVAKMLKEANHCVAFTGAGISTSAGIGDYRGKTGKWTEMDRQNLKLDDEQPSPAKKAKIGDESEETTEEVAVDAVPYEDLRPTFTHEALVKLAELGLIKHVISQNCDGLHGLSGLDNTNLSELHGNVFIEKCEKCGIRYHRPHYVMDDEASQYFEELEDDGKTVVKKVKHAKKCELCGLNHRTGRSCELPKCGGQLIDTIINFCDHLEDSILDHATEQAKQSDLMLCLGTTLFVTPACDLVEMGKEPIRIAICNRQKTYMDETALTINPKTKEPFGSRVFGDCDILMEEVMKNILSHDAMQKWMDGRKERLENYNSKRTTSK